MEGPAWPLHKEAGHHLSLQRLPDEIWALVFAAFDSSSDLLKIVQTCKFLYSLAIRILYRDIQWNGPFIYASNAPFWKRHSPSMKLAPTSLTITISLVNSKAFTRYDPAVGIVEEDGTWSSTPESLEAHTLYEELPHSKKVSFFASRKMYTAITKQISTFAALHELVFHCCELPQTVFPAIKVLPTLRHLSFQFCTLPTMASEPDTTFSELPITELTLWFLKGDSHAVPNSNFVYTMYLCTARNLHKLSIDWCPVSGRFLGNCMPGVDVGPFTGLTELALRFPLLKEWSGEDIAYAAGQCLEEFLVGCPNIKHFSWVNKRARFTLSDTILPNLKSYCGSMLPGLSLLMQRPSIDSIEMTDSDKKPHEIIAILESISKFTAHLKTLYFRMHKWDKEIMYVLVSLFDDLHNIRIVFETGYLSEELLLSLGALFLYQFPGLESLELYQTPSGLDPAAMNAPGQLGEILRTARADNVQSKKDKEVQCPEFKPVDDDNLIKESLNAWRKSLDQLRSLGCPPEDKYHEEPIDAQNDTVMSSSTVNTGLFIGGKWVDPVESATIDVVNPATGKVITAIAAGSSKDVDIAVNAAKQAYKSSWGLKVPGSVRGKLLYKLAELLERDVAEFAALESLDVGKVYGKAKAGDIQGAIEVFRYYAGWADKVQGKTIETNEDKLAYTRHEPYGVVLMLSWKFGPALATGNTIVLKPSEITPLTALRLADLINEAGFPPGVVNIVNGYGPTVGQAISEHPLIEKVAFTGSTLVGRKVLKASAETNLKVVTLELGGKSPTVIFDDADLDQAIKWASHGIFFNMGQSCVAGSRIFVQDGIYDQFLAKFSAIAKHLAANTGDPFASGTQHGPQVSENQFNRVMSYIDSGKQEGATVHTGGARHGEEGYFVQPTIFTDVTPEMKIVQEEIFGPVGVVAKFKTEEEVIEAANNTSYGLGCHVFSQNISRALRVAHALEAGSAWVNCAQATDKAVPFGGYKQSGIGRELGEYALDTYTQVKGVHVNIGQKL
ncbi:hypothetical protein H0H87_001073 [Tephrocybe sp. NHM501043]|nr:hypothetical protein H0H87_001073 [Tephrocybe sp. NHM501043]